MKNIRLKETGTPKEIYVRVVKLTPGKNTAEVTLSKLKEEYDREGSELKSWNIFSGGGIGASIGLIACLASNAVGAPITSPEVFALVGGSLVLGIIAGFVLY